MKFGFPLYLQTLAMLFLYLAAVIIVFLVAFNAQLGIGWEALIKSPVGDRVETIAEAINSQLKATNSRGWNDVLKNFGKIYHSKFYVFDASGTQLAGEPVSLPLAVRDRFVEFPGFGMPGVQVMMRLPPGSHSGAMPLPPGGFHAYAFSKCPGPLTMEFPDPSKVRGAILALTDSASGRTHGGFMLSRRPDQFWIGRSALPPLPPVPIPGNATFMLRTQGPNACVIGGSTLPALTPSSTNARGRFLVHTQNPHRFWIGTRIGLSGSDYGPVIPALLITSCDNIWQSCLLFDFQFAVLSIAAIFILSLIFWWPFVYQITHALSELTVATEHIAEGKFDTRLHSKRRDEIGRLSEAVNTMAEKLSNFVRGQKRFLGDTSHELFSPLARLQLALAVLEETASKEQQYLIADIREEVDEMNSLVQELLAFSKAGLKERSPELSEVNLKALFDDLLSRLDVQKKVEANIPPGLSALADPLLLERSMSNVVRNSIRYAGDCGPINVRALSHGSQVFITVTDHGPGVPEEALKHLGEPFYRPEPSRNRNSGGAGLGLAIVKTCVEACGGSLLLRNRPTSGLEVEVRLKAC